MKLDKMTTHYLVTALWSTSGFEGECDNLDDKYDLSDISDDFKAKAIEECSGLYGLISHLLEEDESDLEQLGHDFWLTRNRHGAGFWDGDYVNGDEISAIVHKHFPENDDELRESIIDQAS